jgi:hypothetical protein
MWGINEDEVVILIIPDRPRRPRRPRSENHLRAAGKGATFQPYAGYTVRRLGNLFLHEVFFLQIDFSVFPEIRAVSKKLNR